jgi:ABC-type transport system substrate-binding protein
LRGSDRFTVEPYALPTIHALVPVSDNPWLTSQTFRRALVYGINRQVILSSELLGNRTLPGCQVISGPFPPGIRDNDPLAYAYDERISARSWYPRLASILVTLARRELKEIAAKRDEEFTEDTKLVLGYPGNEVARVACQSIAQYLQPLGIEIELLELPQGMSVDPEGRADLLYLQVAMWEPVIDARRLLAPAGVTSIGNEYVGMALRRLDAAKNWREARERLHELHRIVHEQVSVVPLWQTVDYLAYSERLRGVGSAPVTLYQNVEQWQIVPSGTDEVKP